MKTKETKHCSMITNNALQRGIYFLNEKNGEFKVMHDRLAHPILADFIDDNPNFCDFASASLTVCCRQNIILLRSNHHHHHHHYHRQRHCSCQILKTYLPSPLFTSSRVASLLILWVFFQSQRKRARRRRRRRWRRGRTKTEASSHSSRDARHPFGRHGRRGSLRLHALLAARQGTGVVDRSGSRTR